MKKIIILTFVMLLLSGCADNVDFTKTKSDTFGELSFEVPEVFEKKDLKDSNMYDSEYYYDVVSYNYSDKNHNCYLYLAQHTYEFSDLKEMVLMNFEANDSSIYSKKVINNNTWGYGTKNNEYIYLINYNKSGYMITYSDTEKCEGVKDIVENSLKLN